jgi:predicted metalloprotease
MRGVLAVLLTVAVIVTGVLVVRGLADGGGGGLDDVLGRFQEPDAPAQTTPAPVDTATPLDDFLQFVFDDTQVFWQERFAASGLAWSPAQLVLHEGAVRSACGVSDSDVGPFYCPPDVGIYIDVPFMDSLDRLGAPGDMAQAYVVAHEMAHHVQAQLGITDRVSAQQAQDPAAANDLSVRLELQADCLAGVWANSTRQRGLLEPGDIEEGLAAAAAVGDDRIQASTTGTVDPDLFTHGTSEQRQTWFLRGFESGDPNACDTFSSDI